MYAKLRPVVGPRYSTALHSTALHWAASTKQAANEDASKETVASSPNRTAACHSALEVRWNCLERREKAPVARGLVDFMKAGRLLARITSE